MNRKESGAENINRRRRPDDGSHDGFEVTIKVSYKTLAMIFALFSVASRIINSLLDTGWVGTVSEKLANLF